MDNQEIKQPELNALDVENQTETGIRPEPTPISNYTPPPAPKKSKKPLIAVLIIVGVILLAGIGFAIYVLFLQPKPSDTVVTQPAPVVDQTDYAGDLMTKIKASETALATTYPSLTIQDNETQAPAYKYSADRYYITGAFGYSISISGPANTMPGDAFMTATETAATDTLTAVSDVKVEVNDFTKTYKNKNVVCAVITDGYPVRISCANVRDYQELAGAIEPFAKAYLAEADNTYISTTVLREPTITKKAAGYSNASMAISSLNGMGGFAGQFYGKGNVWTYWRGTQSLMPCSDYNSYALQASFEGDTCEDVAKNTEGVVKITLKPTR